MDVSNCLSFVSMLSVLDVIWTVSVSDDINLLTKRSDLRCPNVCEYYDCCVCLSQPNYDDIWNLTVHFNTTNYTMAMILAPDTAHTVFFVYHQNGSLNKMPDNICDFKEIVFIDFSFNNIADIDGISCVESLDTLIMKGNRISHLRNSTFINMKYIRYIDLSYNVLSNIEPGFLFNMAGSLFHFNVSHNLLKHLDVTNIIWSKQQWFCSADFSYNNLSEITNELDWKCTDDTQVGHGGTVYLSNNAFTHFFNFSRLGLSDIKFFGKAIGYFFDVGGNNWICDCRFYSYLKLAGPVFAREELTNVSARCHSPPELKDVVLTVFYENNTLDRLICNISIADKCPLKCRCFYQPAKQRTVVNCSNLNFTTLPSALPNAVLGTQLEVDFSQNQISNIDSITEILRSTVFERISLFNLSGNNIKTIPKLLLNSLINGTTIDFTVNNIKQIPRFIQSLHPCHVLLDKIVLNCKCDDKWLQTWTLGTGNICDVQIYCTGKYSLLHISKMTKELFGCSFEPNSILWFTYVLIVLTVTIVIVFILMYSLRFEIFILFRKSMKYFRNQDNDSTVYDFDVYISCNEDDQNLRVWLNTCFVPFIADKYLNVCLPFRDAHVGRHREEEIIDSMTKSRNFVIFLSEYYRGSLETWAKTEWKCAWHNYKRDHNREIVIVNYDMLCLKDTRKS